MSQFSASYAAFYDTLNQKKPYQKEVRFVYDWAGAPKRILDIGCGTADYWKYFPKKAELSGIEISEDMIQQSKYYFQINCCDVTKMISCRWEKVDLATALFDVINYIPTHAWWKSIPIKKGGYFIFDAWDKKKVDRDGFEDRSREIGNIYRTIRPLRYDKKSVDLEIIVSKYEEGEAEMDTEVITVGTYKHVSREVHKMFIHSDADIERFAKDSGFEVVETKETKTWQKWWKLRKK